MIRIKFWSKIGCYFLWPLSLYWCNSFLLKSSSETALQSLSGSTFFRFWIKPLRNGITLHRYFAFGKDLFFRLFYPKLHSFGSCSYAFIFMPYFRLFVIKELYIGPNFSASLAVKSNSVVKSHFQSFYFSFSFIFFHFERKIKKLSKSIRSILFSFRLFLRFKKHCPYSFRSCSKSGLLVFYDFVFKDSRRIYIVSSNSNELIKSYWLRLVW
jgi:hypothetical protein